MAVLHFGKTGGVREWKQDVIVIGDGPAAPHAAAEAAKSGATTLMMSSTGLGAPGMAALTLSASLQEANNRATARTPYVAGRSSATKTSSPKPPLVPSSRWTF